MMGLSEATSPKFLEPVVDQLESEEEGYENPIIIRSKVFDAAHMTVEEAVDHMELVGHSFFLFIDSETGYPSVVYRRKGWTYGSIALKS